MIQAPWLRELLGDGIFMVYELETTDVSRYWLYNGLSHTCMHIWKRTPGGTFRPFRMDCGIHVASTIEANADNLYQLVPVETTCLWCIGHMVRE